MKEQTCLKDPQCHGAHAGMRAGISDYNDGANVTDQLGNDDQNPDVGVFASGWEDEDVNHDCGEDGEEEADEHTVDDFSDML